jgi:hypothetical protein
MRRYTTPRLLIKVSGADLTGCDVYVTFRQGRREHTVKNQILNALNGIREGMNMSVYLDSTTLLAGDGSYVQHRCYEHGGA